MSTKLIKNINTEIYRLIKVNDSNRKNNFEFGEMFYYNHSCAKGVNDLRSTILIEQKRELTD